MADVDLVGARQIVRYRGIIEGRAEYEGVGAAVAVKVWLLALPINVSLPGVPLTAVPVLLIPMTSSDTVAVDVTPCTSDTV